MTGKNIQTLRYNCYLSFVTIISFTSDSPYVKILQISPTFHILVLICISPCTFIEHVLVQSYISIWSCKYIKNEFNAEVIIAKPQIGKSSKLLRKFISKFSLLFYLFSLIPYINTKRHLHWSFQIKEQKNLCKEIGINI